MDGKEYIGSKNMYKSRSPERDNYFMYDDQGEIHLKEQAFNFSSHVVAEFRAQESPDSQATSSNKFDGHEEEDAELSPLKPYKRVLLDGKEVLVMPKRHIP